jgi:hypothetical protein
MADPQSRHDGQQADASPETFSATWEYVPVAYDGGALIDPAALLSRFTWVCPPEPTD